MLASSGHEHKTYELAGSESFTLADLAHAISLASGKTIIYQNLSQEDYAQGLIQAGLPAGLAEVIADADAQTAKGAMFSSSKDLENLIGRKTVPINAQVHALFQAQKS